MKKLTCPVCGSVIPRGYPICEHWDICIYCSAVWCEPCEVINGGECAHIKGKAVPKFECFAVPQDGQVYPDKTYVTMCVNNKCSKCGSLVELDGF